MISIIRIRKLRLRGVQDCSRPRSQLGTIRICEHPFSQTSGELDNALPCLRAKLVSCSPGSWFISLGVWLIPLK